MKLPNSYGSVYKLSGKRRKPWVARKTVGWKMIPEKQKSYPIYEFIGYYEKKADALDALSDYNKDPYDLKNNIMTFDDLYAKWSVGHFEKVSKSNINGCKAAYNLCDKIKDKKLQEIKLEHLQNVVDESGKNYPTLRKLKVLLGLMYDYAVMHEILSPDKRELIKYIDIKKAGNPNSLDREPFKKKEIKKLWDTEDTNSYISIILILIYTGCRIGELLELKKEDIHLEERWFYVRESKTDAGVREVPIAEKIVPFFEYWLKKDCDYLVCTEDNNQLIYRNYYDTYWKPLMESLSMEHRPHDTRHTCVTLLMESGVDERIIKRIVGHKGQGVTQTVYTHVELPIKLDAINKI